MPYILHMPDERWLSREEVASRLGLHPETLRRWALKDEGPPALRIGKLLRYREDELEAWLESRRVGGEPVSG